VTDKDQRTVIFSLSGDDGPPQRLEAFDDFTPVEERPPSALATGLVSVGFIVAAIKRTAPFWCALALLGLLVGVGVAVKYAPSQQAETSILITYGPDENPSSAVFDNQAIAKSRMVAGLALKKLRLQESVGNFTKTITVSILTDSVLTITVTAPTSDEAVSRANAVAAAFLQFRAAQLETAQHELLKSLNQEVSQAKHAVASINSQIRELSAQPASPTRASKLKNLQSQLDQATGQVNVDEQTVQGTKASTATLSAVTGSVVLDPAAALAHSAKKYLLIYAVIGLVVGLGLALGIVVVRAIVSSQLRRRDDVARAVGAPVKLSVGAVKLSRSRSGRRRLAAARSIEVRRIAAYLRGAVSARTRGPAGLAVVAVDDPGVAALSLTSLALSRAREGLTVVLADLAGGAPAAHLLDTRASGVRLVNALDTHLILAVPERDEIAPVGPLGDAPAGAQRSGFTEAVSNACASADLLLTLVTLDPSLGGENLATWAPSAVVIVTAGRSSWAKINAVGEMIRLAGTSVLSAVLVGADKTDESLGVTQHPGILAGTGDLG
jgi:capsular polysaccharide biosynthesis protein